MLKIGITGGIGSGKSTVCKVFEQLNIPLFNADSEAKKLLSSILVKDFYRKEFGNQVFIGEEIDKNKLSALIFNNKEALTKVNAFIHPMVFDVFENWCLGNSASPYVIKEAALLFESQAYKNLDYTLLVTAPVEQRIERVLSRDSSTVADINARMDKQMTDAEKEKLADFVIHNDGKSLLVPILLEIHNNLINRKKIR